MTETTHTGSRRASLGGLVLQLVAAGGVLALSQATKSQGAYHLAWYLLGGVPIWFVALLVFRQRELAALEALDLEELRREKQAGGGGEALFVEEGGGGIGFRVAESRLRWMQRWLIPGFGLATALYLAAMGLLLWRRLAFKEVIGGIEMPALTVGGPGWEPLVNVPIALVILTIVMLGTFLYSRYTSGMGRSPDWQLLRGCGAYMLGNALVAAALLVCLGVQQYTGLPTWEQALAYTIPIVMVVLALETIINFVLDIYRPRAPGVEPRACFDSRLLGLIAEPGGIASSIAEAINYQFGFQVSHTWFYQLLQRAFVPLVATGALALWLLTCLVLVQPYEHVIIERFGRQLNADDPLKPGFHVKWPWPIDVARAYNTGQLHQFSVGFKDPNAVVDYSKAMAGVQLWTDELHMGLEHFDFLIAPQPPTGEEPKTPTTAPIFRGEEPGLAQSSPVHLIRMEVIVQYRIRPESLDKYSQAMSDPHLALVYAAWDEVGRFASSATVDSLLGQGLADIGAVLRQRINARVQDLGLEVVYVGATNVHPEKTVAEAFRNVVKAEQEKVAAVREAMVTENERLSKVAGDARTARVLANAVERARKASEVINDALQVLSEAEPAVVEELSARLAAAEPAVRRHVDAEAQLEWARDTQYEVEQDYELGLGQTTDARRRAAQVVAQAESEERAAAAAVEAQIASVRRDAVSRLGADRGEALVREVEGRVARAYWDEKLDREFTPSRLEGEAARKLAEAMSARWSIEMGAAKELTQTQNERDAYRAAPGIYRARRLMEVLVDGVKDARKYFLAFDPGDRTVRVRFTAEDELPLQPSEISPERAKQP